MKKELLTQGDMNDEGIRTQLNQNDVLEIIVDERYNSIMSRISNTTNKVDEIIANISDLTNEIKLDEIKKFVKKNKIPIKIADIKYPNSSYNVQFSSPDSGVDIPYISLKRGYNNKNAKGEYLTHYTRYTHIPMNEVHVSINLNINTKEKGYNKVTSYSTSYKSKVIGSKFNKLREDIKKLKIECKELFEEFDNINLSYDNILKDVRVAFNKKLIAGGAPKLKDKIKSLFNVELK